MEHDLCDHGDFGPAVAPVLAVNGLIDVVEARQAGWDYPANVIRHVEENCRIKGLVNIQESNRERTQDCSLCSPWDAHAVQ